MGTRLELHSKLKEVLKSDNVYFQPPATIQMKYPCIVYELSDFDIRYADNENYTVKRRYTVTIIDKNPDTKNMDELCSKFVCRPNRFFTANNLNHYVFELYY